MGDAVWLKLGANAAKRFRCTVDSKLRIEGVARHYDLDSWSVAIGDDVLERDTKGESYMNIDAIKQIAVEAGLGDGKTKETALLITGRSQKDGALAASEREEGQAYWGSYDLRCVPPSSCDQKKARDFQENADEPALLNYRPPHNSPPLPLQLAHPVFGEFLDIFYGVAGAEVPGKDDYDTFLLLAAECSRYLLGENADYRTFVRDTWASYIGLDLRTPLVTGKIVRDTEEDVGYECKINESIRCLISLLEAKIGTCGTSAEPAFQMSQHYRLYWDKVGSKTAFARSCFPALGIEHVGPFIRVSALVNLELICCQPLTPFINLLNIQKHDLRQAETGARLCLAVKSALLRLDGFYRDVAGGKIVGVPRDYLERGIPYPLQDRRTCPIRWENKLVYMIKEEEFVMVKYVQREYGEAVHRAWAQAGYAPQLLSVKSYPGGWTEIRMEHLGRGWMPLQALKRTADVLRPQVVQVLRQAHSVPVGSSVGVHGDMRDINVMVRISATGALEEVKFIDFDWAREVGGRYPSFMNHDGINWPEGVADGMLMLQEHDIALLSTRQDLQIK